jgi:hypothetical protein
MARPSRRKRKSANTVGSALDEIGFKPLGRRIKIKAGINQTQLRRIAPQESTASRFQTIRERLRPSLERGAEPDR